MRQYPPHKVCCAHATLPVQHDRIRSSSGREDSQGWSKWGAMRTPMSALARVAGPSMSRPRKQYSPTAAASQDVRACMGVHA